MAFLVFLLSFAPLVWSCPIQKHTRTHPHQYIYINIILAEILIRTVTPFLSPNGVPLLYLRQRVRSLYEEYYTVIHISVYTACTNLRKVPVKFLNVDSIKGRKGQEGKVESSSKVGWIGGRKNETHTRTHAPTHVELGIRSQTNPIIV